MAYNEKTWSAGELLTATGLNQVSDNIAYMLRMLVQDKKLAYGRKQATFGGGITVATAAINFATDSIDGDPGFTSAPFVITFLQPQSGDTSIPHTGVLTVFISAGSVTNLGFTGAVAFYNKDNHQPVNGTKSTIGWLAIGD